MKAGLVDQATLDHVHEEAEAEADADLEMVLSEAMPTAADVERHTYAPSEVDAVYPEDYTGLPR